MTRLGKALSAAAVLVLALANLPGGGASAAVVKQIAPGQFVAVPCPRFEPSRAVKRGEFVSPMVKLVVLMFGE